MRPRLDKLRSGRQVASCPETRRGCPLRSVTSRSCQDGRPSRWAIGLLQPLGKLPCQQLAKQASDTDIGVKIATAPNDVLILFVISINGTIKRQFHKPGESDASLLGDLLGNKFGNLIQLLATWCGFS